MLVTGVGDADAQPASTTRNIATAADRPSERPSLMPSSLNTPGQVPPRGRNDHPNTARRPGGVSARVSSIERDAPSPSSRRRRPSRRVLVWRRPQTFPQGGADANRHLPLLVARPAIAGV